MIEEYDESKHPITRAQFARLLGTQQTSALAMGISRLVYHEPELMWAQDMCLRLMKHSSAQVRNFAALGLGHLAKKHGRIDRARALPLLKRLSSIPGMSEFAANRAISEIERYAPADDSASNSESLRQDR